MMKLIVIVTISCLILSCAPKHTANQLPQDKKELQRQKAIEEFKEPDKETETGQSAPQAESSRETKYPVWFNNPNVDGNFGAVGIAKVQEKGGYSKQRRLAVVLAQAELARQIKVLVDTELTLEKSLDTTETDRHYRPKLQTLSKHEAHELIKNAVVKDEWINESGDLFIWLVIEREDIDKVRP